MLLRPIVLGTAGLFLASAAPPETASPLDPLRQLRALCGGGPERGALLRSRLALAMASDAPGGASERAPALIEGLNAVRFAVTTRAPAAQAWFNQGLALTYGFNHDAAIAAFRTAQRIDPDCAMCFWGEAYARGPNINAPMDPAANARTLAALDRAMALRSAASPRERALIEALALRYSPNAGDDRAALDRAYAEAMARVADRHPGDDDIAILSVEAAMSAQPWDYWEASGRTPKGRMGAAIVRIERVLARAPDHPQAIHLYIHLMEGSATPEKAEAAADRLAKPLVPAAGHLVHMPGHIYYRVGRFRDSIRVNVAAARADEAFLRATDDRGLYRYGYYPHNVHFIVTSAQMGGDKATAMAASERLKTLLGADVALAVPWVQVVWAAPSFAHAQFSSPAEILAQPAPDARMPYLTGMWRYARAVAHALRRDAQGFEQEAAELRRIRQTVDFSGLAAGGVPATDLLEIAEHVARGRLAYAQGRYDDAMRAYRAAVVIEDRIPYTEPPYWYYLVRQSLGAAQLAAGDADGARQTFLEALSRSRGNGWALYGLAEAQRRLGEHSDRRATLRALEAAWLGDRRDLTLARL